MRINKIICRCVVIFVAALLVKSAVQAAPQPQAKDPASFSNFRNSDESTFIKSDSLVLHSKDRFFEYKGNVEVKNGDLTLLADRLEGRYNEHNDITDLVAFNNVHITKGENVKANGEKAVYLAASQTVTITENPEMLKEGSVLSADKITIFLNEDRSEAEGKVRVKLLQEDKVKGTKESR